MLGSAEKRKVRLIGRKLFSKNSNLHVCDHDTSTLQKDGRMDRQTNRLTTCYGNTVL